MRSLYIFLLLTVGHFSHAQQSVYFEKFYDTPVMPEVVTRPFLIDGHYYFAKSGVSVVVDSSSSFEFIKLNLYGETELHKIYSYSWPVRGGVNGFGINRKGQFILKSLWGKDGSFSNKLELRKLSDNGDTIGYSLLFDPEFFYNPSDYLYVDSDDNIYFSGSVVDTMTASIEKSFIFKGDSDLNTIYYKILPYDNVYFLNKVLCLESKNCFFFGNYFNTGSLNSQGVLLKVDQYGNQVTLQEFHEQNYLGLGVSRLMDGNILLSGLQNNRAMLTKIDTNGSVIWDNRYLSDENNGEELYIAREIRNHDIVGVGISVPVSNSDDNNGLIICVDLNGQLKWTRNFGGGNVDFFIDFAQAPDNGFLITGTFTNSNQTTWVLKLDSLGCSYPNCSVGIDELQTKEVVADVWPNPFSSQLNIDWQGKPNGTIEIFNTLWEKVYEAKGGKGLIPTSDFAAGLYEIQVSQGGKTARMKVVKE